MTAPTGPNLAEILADTTVARDDLVAKLAAAKSAQSAAKPVKYRVVRQSFSRGAVVESDACRHRFGWAAQLCTHRRERQHAQETGIHYTVRRAAA